MKIKRYKKAQRTLTFFKNNFGFRPPYQILLDGTFCQAALKNKVNIAEQMPGYLGDEVKLMTSVCVIHETEKLGPVLVGAMLILKKFVIRKCGHEKNPISGDKCLLSLMKDDSNSSHYMIATQDVSLQQKVRRLPGCPIITLKSNAMTLCKPSDASQQLAQTVLEATSEPTRDEVTTLEDLKRKDGVVEPDSINVKKRKNRKEPNPLSIKKKLKKSGSSENPKVDRSESKKDERKRIRKKRNKKLKLPKHVEQLLQSAGHKDV